MCWNTLPHFCFTTKSYHMIVKRTKILVFLVFIMKSVARKTHVLTNGAFTTLPKELESNILKWYNS